MLSVKEFSSKMNDIDPEAYLRAVIARIADHQTKSIDQLMPWNIAL
jgi:transposase